MIKDAYYLMDCADLTPPIFLLPNETSTTQDAAIPTFPVEIADIGKENIKQPSRSNLLLIEPKFQVSQ